LFFSTTRKNLVAIFEATLFYIEESFSFSEFLEDWMIVAHHWENSTGYLLLSLTQLLGMSYQEVDVLPITHCQKNHQKNAPSSGVNRLMTNYVVSFCYLFKMNNTKFLSFHFFQSCSKDFFDKTYWLLVYSVIFYWQKESWDRIIARQCHAHSYHQLISILCGKYAPPQVISL
jgi:hypothetical protein